MSRRRLHLVDRFLTQWLLPAVAAMLGLCAVVCAQAGTEDDEAAVLASEVADLGWILHSAISDNGSWDLFVMRPDGRSRRQLTDTAEWEEAAPRLSPDGRRMLYRRMARGTILQHDRWGFLGQLVLANPDGSEPQVMGEDGELAWGSWSPDGKQVACLTREAVEIVDLQSREVVRSMPRNGIYQQLYWSPDGRWLTGTANVQGALWTVVRMDAVTGAINPVHTNQCCTADWCPDSDRIIFSKREKGQQANGGYGWTELWMADGDGGNARLLFGEESHVYGGAVSPDGRYLIFGRGPKDDGGGGEDQGGTLSIMRLSDAPTILGPTPELRRKHPDVGAGPVLDIGIGWEAFWTDRELWSAGEEQLAAAYRLHETGDHERAVAAFAEALVDPELRQDLPAANLYHAARAACLAAVDLDGPGAGRLQARALDWLAEDLALLDARLSRVHTEILVADDVESILSLREERRRLQEHFEWIRSGDPELESLRDVPGFAAIFAPYDR